jgi:hypothetical protein
MKIDVVENTVLALLTEAPGIGSIHLNKGLLLIDAHYHSLYSRTLTGIHYVKHHYGPVPDADATKIIYEMEFGKVLVKAEKKGGYIQDSYYAAVKPDYSTFPPGIAPEIIKGIAVMISKFTATYLSDMTKNEAWEKAEWGETIPIESLYTIELVDDDSTIELSEEEKRIIAADLEEFEKSGGLKKLGLLK